MTTKLEQDFETWWQREGQEFLYALNTTTDDDIKLVAEVAWKNGAYCAEQAEQEPVIDLSKVRHEDKCRYWDDEIFCDCGADSHELLKWYRKNAAPVRTKDLTDDEFMAIMDRNRGENHREVVCNFARAVIAADREKNK